MPYVSFGGFTHIFIEGEPSGFSDVIVQNKIELIPWDLAPGSPGQMGPGLTSDDEFNTNLALGTLAYRLPSLAALTGWP